MTRNSSSGEILHFNAVRIRVSGSGNLQLSLRSLDDVKISQLPNIPMLSSTNIDPTVLANYIDQAGQLEFKTTEIGEIFIIGRIVIFVKPIFSEYPR